MAYSEASAATDHPVFDEYGHPIEVDAGGFCDPFDPNPDRRHWKKNELSKPLHLIFEYSTTDGGWYYRAVSWRICRLN